MPCTSAILFQIEQAPILNVPIQVEPVQVPVQVEQIESAKGVSRIEIIPKSKPVEIAKTRGRKRKEHIEASEADFVEERPSKQLNFDENAIKIADIQSSCSENLRQVAEKMALQHIHKLGEAKIGDTVQVPVPEVDRGPADLLHVLACIIKINRQHMMYQLATKHGIISGWLSRNAFHICKQKLIKFDSLDLTKEKSLREINALHSLGGGQGFLKCNCTGKCDKNCSCNKRGVFCNSRCHKGNENKQCTRKYNEQEHLI